MLEQFGLSNYENKVYITLINLGISDARTISTESNVPYGRIYDVLDNLKSGGLVNEISGRPKKYTVIEPEIAVNRLMEEKFREVKQLKKHAEYTIQELNKQYDGKPENELVWKVAIGEKLYPTYFDLLSESRTEFLGYLEITEHFSQQVDYIQNYITILRQMHSRGVKIRILLGVSDFGIIEDILNNVPELQNVFSSTEIRYSDTSNQPYSIIDGEKVILKVVNPVQEEEMLAGIYLWQSSLANVLKSSFEELWEDANPLEINIELA